MWLLSNWKAIAAAVGVIALCAFVYLFVARGARIDDLTRQNAVLAETANSNAQALKDMQAKTLKDADTMTMLKRAADARNVAARKREKEILNVPKDQDGAVAPVLRDSLIRLRGQTDRTDRNDKASVPR